jgi:multidrug resistance protein
VSDAGGAPPAAPPQRAVVVVVAVALFLDMLLYGLVVPVVPAYGASLGATPRAIGLVFATYAGALLVASPPLVALSPRLGRRGPLLAGLAGLAIATALFGEARSLGALFAARALQGAAAAASWTAGLALVADAAPEGRRGRAFGVTSAASALGTLLGPPLGGVLADLLGFRAPFRVIAAATAVAFVGALVVLGRGALPPPSPGRSPVALLRDREARAAFALVAVGAAALGVLEPLLPLHLAERLGASAGRIGLTFAVATIAYGAAGPIVGRGVDARGAAPYLRAGWLGVALLLPALAWPRSEAAELALMAAMGVALAALVAPTMPALAARADHVGGDYATAYAGYNAAYAVGLGLGAALGGPIASAVGVREAFGVVAIALLVGGAAPALAVGSTRGGAPRS